MTQEYVQEQKGNFPKGWVYALLNDVSLQIDSGFSSGKHNMSKKGVPHLRPMNISAEGLIDLSVVKYVQVKEYDALKKGDIFFNNTNSAKLVGKTAHIEEDTDWAYSNHMTRIRTDESFFETKWIATCLHFLFITGFYKMNRTQYVNQASIGKTFLQTKVRIPIPPLPEQRRIISKIDELLSNITAIKAASEKIIPIIEQYRQSLLNYAFEGKLTEKWREENQEKIEPASVLLEKIKRDKNSKSKKKTDLSKSDFEKNNENHLPINWINVTLDSIVRQEKNSIKRGPFGSTIKKEFFVPSGFKVYEQKNVIRNDFTLGNYYLTKEKFLELKDFEVNSGDLLVSCSGTIGRVTIVPDNIQKGIINQALLKITLDPNLVNTKYFLHLFESNQIQSKILHDAHGSAMKNFASVKELKQTPFPISSINEQKKIVSIIEHGFSIIENIEKIIHISLKKIDGLKWSILKDAFEGKLVPQDPNDEPTTILIEKFKKQYKES